MRGGREAFRPEVQGLRAVAVLLIVLFHLWPDRLTGGYVGVDVFFVISGYLITGHLLREVERTGTLLVRRFWARRVRRLLPASLLVLLVSGGAVLLLTPATAWAQNARELAASALLVQNWALARDSVDYLAHEDPTVAQHFWSLSLEEQFYLGWPLLLLGLTVAARTTSARPRGVLVAGVGAVVACSLVWSVVSTYDTRSVAYVSTFSRAWEFAAGALVALVAWRPPRRTGEVLAWGGLAAVAWSAWTYGADSMFPGWIALVPVLGTAAVLMAVPGSSLASAGTWLAHPVPRFLGDVSYAVYLWHWPLIVLLPHVTGRPLSTVDKVAVLVATVVLAWVTKALVEDPGRRTPLLGAAPWRAFAFAACGTAVVVLAGAAVTEQLARREAVAQARAASVVDGAARCLGPSALDPAQNCPSVLGTGDLLVPAEVASGTREEPGLAGCQQTLAEAELLTCVLSPGRTDGRVVALVGDSHVTHWFPAFRRIGEEQGWRVVSMTKSSCPLTSARRTLPQEQGDERLRLCQSWQAQVREALRDPAITDVVVSAFSSAYGWTAPPGHDMDRPGVEGFAAAWEELARQGKRVTVMAAVPRTLGSSVPDCLAAHPDDMRACAVPRSAALPEDPLVRAVEQLDDPRVRLLSVNDRFCDRSTCYPVTGDVIVYRDVSHLTPHYARLLAPLLRQRFHDLWT